MPPVNPRVMEGYVPGVDDEPSSFTNFDVTPVPAIPINAEAMVGQPTPLNDASMPLNQPIPPSDGAALNQPTPLSPAMTPMQPPPADLPPPPVLPAVLPLAPPPAPVVAPLPDEEQPDPPMGGSVQTPLTGPSHKTPGDASSHQASTGTQNMKKWILIAIGASLALAVLIILVAIIALGGGDSDDDGTDPPTTPDRSTDPPRSIALAIPNNDEMRRAVTALMTGNDVDQVEQTYGTISTWDVSQVTDFSRLIADQTGNVDVSGWDVSNGVNFRGIFQNATAFNGDISKWDVSKVQKMDGVFRLTAAFDGDISNWDTSNHGRFAVGNCVYDNNFTILVVVFASSAH